MQWKKCNSYTHKWKGNDANEPATIWQWMAAFKMKFSIFSCLSLRFPCVNIQIVEVTCTAQTRAKRNHWTRNTNQTCVDLMVTATFPATYHVNSYFFCVSRRILNDGGGRRRMKGLEWEEIGVICIRYCTSGQEHAKIFHWKWIINDIVASLDVRYEFMHLNRSFFLWWSPSYERTFGTLALWLRKRWTMKRKEERKAKFGTRNSARSAMACSPDYNLLVHRILHAH